MAALDNAVRFISIRKHSPIRPVAGNWTSIWDWSKQKLLDTIEQSGISLRRDYTFLPRSFDGFSYLFLMPLKEHYPRDYEANTGYLPGAQRSAQEELVGQTEQGRVGAHASDKVRADGQAVGAPVQGNAHCWCSRRVEHRRKVRVVDGPLEQNAERQVCGVSSVQR